MLHNLKPLIAKALLSNSAIVEYVAKDSHGHPVIGSNKLVAGLFPAIEFHQVGGGDLRSVDDTVDVREYRLQFTIFTKDSSHYLVENVLDTIMRDMEFRCYFDHEMYDDTLDITQRVLLYRVYLTDERFKSIEAKLNITSQEAQELNAL